MSSALLLLDISEAAVVYFYVAGQSLIQLLSWPIPWSAVSEWTRGVLRPSYRPWLRLYVRSSLTKRTAHSRAVRRSEGWAVWKSVHDGLPDGMRLEGLQGQPLQAVRDYSCWRIARLDHSYCSRPINSPKVLY